MPVPHDPRPGTPGPLVHRRHVCLMWAHVATERIHDAETVYRVAKTRRDMETMEGAETVILDHTAILREWLL